MGREGKELQNPWGASALGFGRASLRKGSQPCNQYCQWDKPTLVLSIKEDFICYN